MKKILLMEDHAPQAMELIQQLETYDYEAVWARNATEAMGQLGKMDFDAVVADIFVREGMTLTANGGVTLIGKIRTAAYKIKVGKGVRQLPIIAISAGFDPGGADNFLTDTVFGVGGDAALPKPVDMEKLRTLIEEMTSAPGMEKLAQ